MTMAMAENDDNDDGDDDDDDGDDDDDDDDDDNDCTEFRHLASYNVDKTIHLSFRS